MGLDALARLLCLSPGLRLAWLRKCLDRRSARSVGQPQQSGGIGTLRHIYRLLCPDTSLRLFLSLSLSSPSVLPGVPFSFSFCCFWRPTRHHFYLGNKHFSAPTLFYSSLQTCDRVKSQRIYVYLKVTGTLLSLCTRSPFCSPDQQTLLVGNLVLLVTTSLGPHQGFNGSMLTSRPSTHTF